MAISYVVPAHNSTHVIETALDELAQRLAGQRAEVIVVENGSTDGTPELLKKLESEWSAEDVQLRVLSSAKGMGNALRVGIEASKGATVITTADDLPFGFDDLDRATELGLANNLVYVGSKAHPESQAGRGLLRAVLTTGFLIVRKIILGMDTRDPQGTFILDGEWVRGIVSRLTETGYLFTTEIAYVAERNGIRPVEVPVRLRVKHDQGASRIRVFTDARQMLVGLLRLRRNHRARIEPVAPEVGVASR